MSFTGSFRLETVEYKQAEGGSDQRYVVTFSTYASGDAEADIMISIPLNTVPETDLVKEAQMRCHRFLNHLAGETKNWDPSPT